MSTDLIAAIANIALTLTLIVTIFFGVAQIKGAKRDRRERLTLDALRDFQSKEFSELLIYIYNSKLPAGLEEWQELPASDKVSLVQFSQTMESLGIAVAEGYIDTELVDKTIGSVVTVSWDKLKPWIFDARANQPDPYLNEYFQWLAERLSAQMHSNPRRPFYQT